MKKIETMHDLYVNLLQDAYNSEQQLLKILPKMAQAATMPQLYAVFEAQEDETHGQMDRLQQIFAMLNIKGGGEKCEATEGMIHETQELFAAKPSAKIMDAGLIACAQKVEHYEMASYGTLCEFARMLAFDEQLELLEETFAEKKSSSAQLTALGKGGMSRMPQAA